MSNKNQISGTPAITGGVFNYDVRTIQLVPMNKCRQIFVFDASLADKNTTSLDLQLNHIKSRFILRDSDNVSTPLRVWKSGSSVYFESISQDALPSYGNPAVLNEFNATAGCIYIGYKPVGAEHDCYLIVGTGDFRNGTLDMRYWVLPGPTEPTALECTQDFKIKIYSKTPFL